ncbi:6-carboxytetrahydropterin synthase [Streptomyces sp. NPDC006670]|uniref:6-pyruvoyl trahydropterin synthase family protein n=1 Tax=Streptomyces sp. NPDC006670 TaxID=3154476 RepID=UPI0033CCF0CA
MLQMGTTMIRTTREITLHFEATHAMPLLPQWHHEHNIHGHQYELGFEFSGPAAATAGAHEPSLQEWIDDQLRGQHLNEILGERPTAEHFAMRAHAQWVEQLPGLSAVRVSALLTTLVIKTPRPQRARSTGVRAGGRGRP